MRPNKVPKKIVNQFFKPYQRDIFFCNQRLQNFYRYSKSDGRRMFEDQGKADFLDVWRVAVPPQYREDKKLAKRIGDLCKFNLLTYGVLSLDKPFAGHFRPTDYENFRRTIHKQVKLYHGV